MHQKLWALEFITAHSGSWSLRYWVVLKFFVQTKVPRFSGLVQWSRWLLCWPQAAHLPRDLFSPQREQGTLGLVAQRLRTQASCASLSLGQGLSTEIGIRLPQSQSSVNESNDNSKCRRNSVRKRSYFESYPHISYISFSLANKSDYKCVTIIISGNN